MSLFFDKRDRDLLKIVNGVLSRSTPDIIGKKGLFPWFHPHGIKELAETRGLRIAYAVGMKPETWKTVSTPFVPCVTRFSMPRPAPCPKTPPGCFCRS